jgi:hypothetical protein
MGSGIGFCDSAFEQFSMLGSLFQQMRFLLSRLPMSHPDPHSLLNPNDPTPGIENGSEFSLLLRIFFFKYYYYYITTVVILIRAPMHSNVGELCDFLNNCWMATPLRGCQAPSICTNVLGLRPMGWSVRSSTQGSIITFI